MEPVKLSSVKVMEAGVKSQTAQVSSATEHFTITQVSLLVWNKMKLLQHKMFCPLSTDQNLPRTHFPGTFMNILRQTYLC